MPSTTPSHVTPLLLLLTPQLSPSCQLIHAWLMLVPPSLLDSIDSVVCLNIGLNTIAMRSHLCRLFVCVAIRTDLSSCRLSHLCHYAHCTLLRVSHIARSSVSPVSIVPLSTVSSVFQICVGICAFTVLRAGIGLEHLIETLCRTSPRT